MGIFRIKKITRFFAWSIAALLLYLNLKLVLEEGEHFFSMPGYISLENIVCNPTAGCPGAFILYFNSSLDE